jgi:hypothetical protein
VVGLSIDQCYEANQSQQENPDSNNGEDDFGNQDMILRSFLVIRDFIPEVEINGSILLLYKHWLTEEYSPPPEIICS